jgi:hypothetical protein
MRQQALHGAVNWDWHKMLEQVQGMTLEVETKFLFAGQYNTVPIPGVSEQGMRIMDESVDEVIDDIRPSRKRCNWCGHHSDINAEVCENCERNDYFEKFRLFKRKVTKLDYDRALENFISEAQAIVNAYCARNGFDHPSRISADLPGKKYTRIIITGVDSDGREIESQKSAYCFINQENGDILKTASWKAPVTKNPRGNIYKPETIEWAVEAHGASYLR